MTLTHDIVEHVLTPLKKPFIIQYDGTSQTKSTNTGRFGFYIERQFNILPNNDRSADTEYAEFKSVNIKNNFTVKPISIGTIPIQEYNRLVSFFPNVSFINSDPFKKMSKTLYIFYRKKGGYYTDAEYHVDSWVHIDMANLDEMTLRILENDYWQCVQTMTKYSYNRLSCSTSQNPNTHYLQLGYKGDGYYNYPCWKFSTAFLKKMYAIGKSVVDI